LENGNGPTGAVTALRTDSPDPTVGLDDSSTADRPVPLRSRVAKAWPALLGGLVLGTSVAVALVAWWLVPPYLILIAFLLYEPDGRRVSATNPAGPDHGQSSGRKTPGVASDPADGAGSDDSLGDSPSGGAQGGATAATKARRTGKKARKARATVEPAPATWVQVAPGKFVRAEPGADHASPGPHPPQTDGSPEPAPLSVPGEETPSVDHPDRPPADPGTQDAPTEEALDPSHLESTSPAGLAPTGQRDPEDAHAGTPRDVIPRSVSFSFYRDHPPGFDPAGFSIVDASPCLAPEVSVATDSGRSPEDVESESHRAFADADRPREEPAHAAVPDPDPIAHHKAAEAEDDATADEARDDLEAEPGPPVDDPETELAEDRHADAEGDEPYAEAEAFDDDRDEGSSSGYADDVEDEYEDIEDEDVSPGSRPAASGTSYRRDGHSAWPDTGVSPPRRNVRSARSEGLPPGLRLRSRRGDGRSRHFVRTFPPRSPPRNGAVRALTSTRR
jgi:hypothetical protein